MIVILIIADSVRGSPRWPFDTNAETPLIDQLAASGTGFEHAFASATWSIPSMVSMLTGQWAHRLGVTSWRHRIQSHTPTLFSAFAKAGFEVICCSPRPHHSWRNVPIRGTIIDSQEPERVVDALLGRTGHDRLVLIHHWWTHLPYINAKLSRSAWQKACDLAVESLGRNPELVAGRLQAAHYQSLSYFSRELLSRYLDAAARGGERVLLALTSDHGETWGASFPQGHRAQKICDLHGRWITDETVRVPLLFWGDAAQEKIPQAQRLGGIARGVDVGPTLAQLAGVPFDDGSADGCSLVGCIFNGDPAPAPEAITFSSTCTPVPQTDRRSGREMWRTLGLRTPEQWFVYDGVEDTLVVAPVSGVVRGTDRQHRQVRARLRTLWSAAVDTEPLIEHSPTPGGFRPDRGEDRQRCCSSV